MPLTTGQTLHHNRYRIVKPIGQGGFGAVYRAWDITLKQPIALKENLDTSQEAQRQFEREARLMAGLRHANLPRVLDHFFVPGQGQYLVMDFIEGSSLAELLSARSGNPFSEAEILPWLQQVCAALDYLHNRQPPIIHRDIKPENIIITLEGQAILVDFGISKVYDSRLATTVGARAVTPGYSPPEQYGGGKTDARTDIYALGATLYRLLTGQEPPSSVEIVAGVSSLTPPRDLVQQLNPALERTILQAMSVNVSQRFERAADFLAALETPDGKAGPVPVTILAKPNVPHNTPVIPEHRIAEKPSPRQPVPEPRPALAVPLSGVAIPHIVKGAAPLALDWCWIPGGTFRMGGEYHDEKPIHDVHVDGFWLARYPVTNEQFRLFIEAGGYTNQQWWTAEGWQMLQRSKWAEPRYWQESKWNGARQPVVGVSWHETVAFCAWAAEVTGKPVRLPTEAEWEKGARGTDGRTFPWGEVEPSNQLCNSARNVGPTTLVGQYSPQGDSPYGCADMAGNVWEWCLSKHKPYPYQEGVDRNNNGRTDVRVVRGGSWKDYRDVTRCAYRSRFLTHVRVSHSGFRCASDPL